MDFSAINWIAVLVAAVAFFALGAIWYGPVFGKAWQKGVGLSDDEMKNANMGKLFGSAFVFALIISVGMAIFFFGFGTDPENPMDATMGAMYGLMTGIFFILPSTCMNYLFARKSASLMLIDSFYHIIAYTIVGIILGAWH
ncbi:MULTISPECIES: DUF1761 domain-containing protein [Roseivirga]|jgi:uncharacterized membrane protein|uniref:DUF1761 domain-containing protein n=1 Tax=Roseivirga spongicola TaxID=333140 RepID=A0A150XHS9_9BACT|nr:MULTISPECIES: DUF1761 domain-containing protein [Roseivirga]PWL31025.1 MAG: DUF1761 domain-containing protein [Roseivirga sp. XM-24bin3]KYG78277.1 hypothetical protein AWW68_05790 [Roseivirga spongicola]MBO6494429.1 DUF1761 domain-containing protein [Roseivirga sp.]MBO6660896.1 DUF1761 domain-containing protein [Roseivirga sp.]MBO6909120.1 DUF1761 domain-containing protein [Roseivirga sp.]